MGGAVWTLQDPGIACTFLGIAGGMVQSVRGDTAHLDAFAKVGLHHRHYKE